MNKPTKEELRILEIIKFNEEIHAKGFSWDEKESAKKP